MKRKDVSTFEQPPSKRIKLVSEEREYNPAIHVLTLKELLSTITSFLDESRDMPEKHTFHHLGLSAMMLATVSKSLNKVCIQIARENFHYYSSLKQMKTCALAYGYTSCFRYLHEFNPLLPSKVEFIAPDIETIDVCKEYDVPVHALVWNEIVERGTLECIRHMHGIVAFPYGITHYASARGSEEVIELLLEFGCHQGPSDIDIFAGEGHLECIKKFDKYDPIDGHGVSSAAKKGQFECLKYFIDKGHNAHPDIIAHVSGEQYEKCVKYLLSEDYGVSRNACRNAAKNGSLKYLKEFSKIMDGVDQQTVVYAAGSTMEVLEYAYNTFGRMPVQALDKVNPGELGKFKYILDRCNPKEIQDRVFSTLKDRRFIDCLMDYSVKHGIRINFNPYWYEASMDVIEYAISTKLLNFEYNEIVECAIKNSLDCVKMLKKYGISNVKIRFNRVPNIQHRVALKYAIKNKICTVELGDVIEKHDTDMLKFLIDNGVSWEPGFLCNTSAKEKSLYCLKYAIKRGDKPTKDTMVIAIRNEWESGIKCIHDNGVEWNTEFTTQALFEDSIDTFWCLLLDGCPYDRKECQEYLHDDDLTRMDKFARDMRKRFD